MFNLGILTVSDKCWRGQREDTSGKLIRDNLSSLDSRVVKQEVVPDEAEVVS